MSILWVPRFPPTSYKTRQYVWKALGFSDTKLHLSVYECACLVVLNVLASHIAVGTNLVLEDLPP